MAPIYESINYDTQIPDLTQPFSIACSPKTDVWEKPPSTNSFNAPIIYQKTTKGQFSSAKITISGKWQHRYDQGGLALVINTSDKRRWIKSGIELYENKPFVSCVATDQWSDWSLRPTLNNSDTATIEMVNENLCLWIYLVDTDGSKVPMREVNFWGSLSEDVEIWVGPYAAKPAEEEQELVVHFENFEVATK